MSTAFYTCPHCAGVLQPSIVKPSHSAFHLYPCRPSSLAPPLVSGGANPLQYPASDSSPPAAPNPWPYQIIPNYFLQQLQPSAMEATSFIPHQLEPSSQAQGCSGTDRPADAAAAQLTGSRQQHSRAPELLDEFAAEELHTLSTLLPTGNIAPGQAGPAESSSLNTAAPTRPDILQEDRLLAVRSASTVEAGQQPGQESQLLNSPGNDSGQLLTSQAPARMFSRSMLTPQHS